MQVTLLVGQLVNGQFADIAAAGWLADRCYTGSDHGGHAA